MSRHRALARLALATVVVAAASTATSIAATSKPSAVAPAQGGVVLSVARASVNQVVLLHDLAVGATHLKGAPPGVGAPQAAQLTRTLRSAARQLGGSKPADVSSLASALSGYAGLASKLARRPASDSARLSKAFVTTLRKLDGKWRPAVAAIGRANHVNLLTAMAPLLIPPTA